MYSAYKLNKQGDNIQPWCTPFLIWMVLCSMSSSNCCFLTCIQISQEAGQVVWYSHLLKNCHDLTNLNYLFKGPVSNIITLSVRASIYGFGGLPLWLSRYKICLQCRKPRADCWVQKICWRRKWQPILVFLLGKSHGQWSLVGYSPWGHKSWTWLSD